MNVLVIGSEGFIGSHTCNYLASRRHSVYKADIVMKDEENYFALNPEQIDFSSLFLDRKYDVCLNASGAANVQFSFNYPALDYSLNVSNVYMMLEAIRRYNPACRFINLSSAAVYGNVSTLPIAEKNTGVPLSPYGWHKLYSEQICREFATYFSIGTISLRIFSAYGPGLKKQLFWDLYNKFRQAEGEEVELFGTGNETRDFIYIDDLVKAFELIAEKADFSGQSMNVSSGTETTVLEAAETLRKHMKASPRIRFNGREKHGDPKNWRADIHTLRGFGFTAATTIDEGLRNYAEWAARAQI
jgi:UDP-glucose 4-epimerase